ncbi:MAG: hypothetical protein K2P12_04845 [Clostridia bacterium]|nr:hypothetical protein [Clostridia bacterium]
MKFLHIDSNENIYKVNILKYLLPFTFMYKMWFLAEMVYNQFVSTTVGPIFGRIIMYAITGLVAFLLCLLAVNFSYRNFSRSKYSPCDEYFYCRVNKPTYYMISYFAIIVSNIISGSLNFIAYAFPVSIIFIVITLPAIMAVITIFAIIGLLSTECRSGELKQLIVSMIAPSIWFLILLR